MCSQIFIRNVARQSNDLSTPDLNGNFRLRWYVSQHLRTYLLKSKANGNLQTAYKLNQTETSALLGPIL